MTNICTIGARGGSKGVPNKNIRPLLGKALLAYTIEQALETELFEHVLVTTDSDEIARAAERFGAEAWFRRPGELATNEASKLPAIRHAVVQAEARYKVLYDVVVDLDVTSPLRLVDDIHGAYNQFLEDGNDVLITGTPSRKSPYFNMVEICEGRVQLLKPSTRPIVRRQDAPKCYDMNASVYVWKRDVLMREDSLFLPNTGLYVMPQERSVDIDTETDFAFVEFLMHRTQDAP